MFPATDQPYRSTKILDNQKSSHRLLRSKRNLTAEELWAKYKVCELRHCKEVVRSSRRPVTWYVQMAGKHSQVDAYGHSMQAQAWRLYSTNLPKLKGWSKEALEEEDC